MLSIIKQVKQQPIKLEIQLQELLAQQLEVQLQEPLALWCQLIKKQVIGDHYRQITKQQYNKTNLLILNEKNNDRNC